MYKNCHKAVTSLGVCLLAGAALLTISCSAPAQNPAAVVISVDAAANRHPISPNIYGVCIGGKDQLAQLNAPINRYGGNGATQYNWKANAWNHANDWYFESIAEKGTAPGDMLDSFISDSKASGADPLITIPMIGWVAKIGQNRETIPSFSVAKYGPQQKTDPYNADAGNGVKPDGTNITGNDPNDANIPADATFQAEWVRHLVDKWGSSTSGGVKYYIMDNEDSLWPSTHRDVHPVGPTMDEILNDIISYGSMVKSIDPNAKIVAPEEWGWPGFLWSGYDQQYRNSHHWQGSPDKDAHGGLDYYPWLLSQLRLHDAKTGHRLLDVLTVHVYPQGGEGNDDVSLKTDLLRNRSTRSLWDPNYKDESWINDKMMIIPRLKQWVAQYYPGTKIGITEYNWGAEKNISGATAQADIFGIFGREGLDLATRWTTPDPSTPTFKAMQLYRNYDGSNSTFGNVSVQDTVPDPDSLSSFASVRKSDHALTIMVINKVPGAVTPITINLANFPAVKAQAWQLTSDNVITPISDVALNGNSISAVEPAQSVTLYVVTRSSN